MKKFLSFVIIFLITIATFSSPIFTFADSNDISLSSPASVLIDYETGKVLYEKNGDKKIYPASTTKIWTAYLVIKSTKNLNDTIEITEDPNVDGSCMYLQKGEIFTVKELLQGLLIHSSNDAAEVLAKYVSGSISDFADLMNKEAKAIGCKNTHFNNPHGLPDKNHYTTAYDMALIAREAMSNDLIRDIVKTKSITFEQCDTPTSRRLITRTFYNTNKFLTSNEKIDYKGKSIDIKYDIVDGIKTGYTDDAGRCLLSSAVKNNMRVIAAVYKDYGTNVYVDSRKLLDYAFSNFSAKTIIKKSDYAASKRVLFTKEKELLYEPESNYKVVLENGESLPNDYSTETNLDYSLPLKKGDKVGTLDIYNGKTLEKSIDLVAKNDLTSVFSFIQNQDSISYYVKAGLAVIALAILFIIRKIFKRKPSKRKHSRK